jgi:hypothetical protein
MTELCGKAIVADTETHKCVPEAEDAQHRLLDLPGLIALPKTRVHLLVHLDELLHLLDALVGQVKLRVQLVQCGPRVGLEVPQRVVQIEEQVAVALHGTRPTSWFAAPVRTAETHSAWNTTESNSAGMVRRS